MANHELSEQEIVRRNSMNALRERGIEPYPAAEYEVTGHTREIKENFRDGEEPVREVAVAGRVMSRRIMGKASFMELQDADGGSRFTSPVMTSVRRRQGHVQCGVQKTA